MVDSEVTARLAERTDVIASGWGIAIGEQYNQREASLTAAGVGARGGTMAVRKMYQLARHDEVLRGHAFGDRLVDVVADLLATHDLKLYNDQLFMKPAYHGGEQSWHQDSQAWMNMFRWTWSPPGRRSTKRPSPTAACGWRSAATAGG